MRQVRAKFRCLGIDSRWDKTLTVELAPVLGNKGHSPENKLFWEATPIGNAKLTFYGECPFTPGDYYYIDMTPNQTGKWCLAKVTRTGYQKEKTGGEITFHGNEERNWQSKDPGFSHGTVEMNIEQPPGLAALEFFQDKEGSMWDIEFSFAESSDN